MMNYPITTNTIIQHCELESPAQRVISATTENEFVEFTYAELAERIRQLANALTRLGIKPGDRVATLAWNSHQHLELYYAVSGIGAICHTINPRYSTEQIIYIVEHAQDTALFYDDSFSSIVESIKAKTTCIHDWIAFSTKKDGNDSISDYEQLLAKEQTDYDWPHLDENSHAALCYTSGTTGNPKGVLYTHRSTFLHATFASQRDALDISSRDIVCPIVPMFHVNAWGIPYIAPLTGAGLVLPGPDLSASALFNLFSTNKVTMTAGVPTILGALITEMQRLNKKPDALETVVIGGAAAPPAMIRALEEDFGIRVLHGWGMTETSPLATINTPKPELAKSLNQQQMMVHKEKQGRKLFGVELKLVDDSGKQLPNDGVTSGRLLIKGAWVVDAYYKSEQPATDAEGWFDTGDISTIDEFGYMQIVDRSKDVIKSGGEWISSVQLENIAAQHENVAQAAVIGLPHDKWLERPLLVVVPTSDDVRDSAPIIEYLTDKIPRWWMPDAVVFVEQLPIGATGKIQKNKLRERFPSFDNLG